MLIGNYPARITAANVIAAHLANHGIEVSVQEKTHDEFAYAFNNREYEVLIAGIHTGFSPKVSALFENGNVANYYNDNLNIIMEEIRNNTDYAKQKEIYNRLYDEYLNGFPYIFLFRNIGSVVYNQTLCGKISPNAYSMFYNIEKWYRQ